MMFKIGKIFNLVILIIISFFMINLFIGANNIIARIFLLPFIVCVLASIGKNIFMIKDNYKYSNIFSNIYFISFFTFFFGILVIWCYLVIRDGNYAMLIFSIPFWIIGIFFVSKKIFKKNISLFNKFRRNGYVKINFRKIISGLLIGSCLVIGVVMLYFGISGVYKLNNKTKDFKETTGYFTDYTIYYVDRDGTTYKLIYSYTVDGEQYTISSDLGTGIIPDRGSTKPIKYNPNKPKDAVIVGVNSQTFLIFIGLLFTFVPLIMILGFFRVFDKVKLNVDLMGIFIGIFFSVMGLGIIYMLVGSFSILDMFSSYSNCLVPCIISILFIIVGLFMIIKSIFFNKKTVAKLNK